MEVDALKRIRDSLKDALKELTRAEIVDSKLRSRYAEYLVAYKLAKKGHKVQLSNERDNKNADIYLVDKRKRVEVKSGKYNDDGRTNASFGNGNQISGNKFDYCVFVTFDAYDESVVKEMFIFKKEELSGVVEKSRKKVAKHPETNPCLLLRYKNFEDYTKYIKDKNLPELDIEIDFNRDPRKYDQVWNKIK